MKKVALTLAVVTSIVGSSFACQTIKGKAQLTPLGEGKYRLTCKDEGDCAKLNCNVKDITIYLDGTRDGASVNGTLGSPLVVEPVDEDNVILVEPVIVTVQ